MQIEPILMEPILMEPILMEPILMEPILMEPILMEPFKSFKIKYSYNHFKSLKQAFNSNLCKSINIISLGCVAMLEGFKRCTNKIFILNNCKNKIILKIIIIKIIVLIKNNDIFIPDKFTKDWCKWEIPS